MTPELKKLMKGHQQFQANESDQALYEELAHGQSPKVMVISCSDSRVDPVSLFSCHPGEIFVVRNVANLVPSFENSDHASVGAALEYAVKHLKVTDIVVLGHSQCGGIHAVMNRNEAVKATDFIDDWIAIAEPAKANVLEQHPDLSSMERTQLCERESLVYSLNNLQTYPWIKAQIEVDELHLHAWHFDIATRSIHAFDREEGGFASLVS